MIDKLKKYWLYLPAFVLAVITTYPILWNVSGAFKGSGEAKSDLSLIPKHPTLKNFITIFQSSEFSIYISNTVIYAGTVTIFVLLISSMAGFSLARLKFPGRDFIFLTILSTLMIPFSVIMIPLFLIVKAFGWVDSLTGLIIPNLFTGFGIFLLRQFYMGIPRELEEAGEIDGLSLFGIYFRVVLPLSKPILYALAIFVFLANWNNYLWPLIVISSEENWVLTQGIASFASEHTVEWNLIMAGTTVGIIPTILLFAVFQKQLVEGIKMTGMK